MANTHRIKSDATDINGDPHPFAGFECNIEESYSVNQAGFDCVVRLGDHNSHMICECNEADDLELIDANEDADDLPGGDLDSRLAALGWHEDAIDEMPIKLKLKMANKGIRGDR